MRNSPEVRTPSVRAATITRRTYSRPLEGGGFESWDDIVGRVVSHQRWLWQRALGDVPLNTKQEDELEELRDVLLRRSGSVSGRTLWLGGTEVAKRREASMFNCAFTKVETVHDVVDSFWLLLQGCGVGFEPVVGTLNGFTAPMEIEVVRSQRHLLEQKKGRETNVETYTTEGDRLWGRKTVWTISVGDSAEAWAKSVGKMLAGKRKADVLRLDFSQIRPAGQRLKGYGWISSGDETFAPAMQHIAEILNNRAGHLLSRIDILDVLNHLGTTLSSRRSAEIALVPFGDAEWVDFAKAKKDFWLHNNYHRQQSNNSVTFHAKPNREDIAGLFDMMQDAGGSEPGFINFVEGKRRGPWMSGVNPCAEILLPNKGFCNLVEINLSHFNGIHAKKLWRVAELLARANYRQTCVNLVDGVLQRAWHENNEFLRLCGVGVTGVAEWEPAGDPSVWRMLRDKVKRAANGMADELGLPRPKAVTTVKPSGTLSKIMDTTEGVHKPLGRYIFNNVRFSKHDPFVQELVDANYKVIQDPSSQDAVLVTFPVAYPRVHMDEVDGKFVNLEPATVQLARYKTMMDNYVDHNCSVTISYSPEEAPEIVDWLHENWESYVGVSFLYRTDPTKTAKDLGYLYLPQQVITEEEYNEYVSTLKPIKGEEMGTNELVKEADDFEIDTGSECATGACPVR
jgi:adenosylcobalamin-dependent ribonucleoside-triphosphate reductase